MNIWQITIRNIKSKPLYTVLSIFMLSLSIALLLGILQLKTSFKYQMDNNLGDIDMVVGAKGSPLQLILSSVLHIDNPTGNINYSEAKELSKNPMIEKAVPISYGDNYKGYRIVGTTSEFFNFYNAEIAQGRQVKHTFEVVLGSIAANQLNLKLGDVFQSSHGLVENTIDVHDDDFKVVGIIAPTQKVIDRLIICNLKTIWDVHDHDHNDDEHDHDHGEHEHEDHNHDHGEHEHDHGEHEHDHGDHNDDDGDHKHDHREHEHDHGEHEHDHGEHEHDHGEHEHDHGEHEHDQGDHDHDHGEHEHDNGKHEHNEHENDEHSQDHEADLENKEVTSILVSYRNPRAVMMLPRTINENTNMQAALPKFELNRLYEFTGVGFKTVSWIAYIILIISGLTIFISLYKMIKERAFDLALLRTYGASNGQLVKMVSYEGLTIVIIALIIGFLFSNTGLYFIFNFVETGPQSITIQPLPYYEVLQIIGLVFVMIILSVALAIRPIMTMNISTILSNEK